MQTESQSNIQRSPFRIPIWLGFCLFLAIAVFFLWEAHKAHMLGALPYVLLLLCPVIHFFMHGRQGGHGRNDSGHEGHAGRQHEGGLS